MKKCPFCAEDIQDAAIKCRYCGSMLGAEASTTQSPEHQIEPSVENEVVRLLNLLRRGDAIKLVAERKNVSEFEATAYVDQFEARLNARLERSNPTSLLDADVGATEVLPEPMRPRRSTFPHWLIGLGLALAVYFFLFFDVSVEVPARQIFGQTVGGGRVANLSLMAERQNGIIFGFGLAFVGAVLRYFRGRNDRGEEST